MENTPVIKAMDAADVDFGKLDPAKTYVFTGGKVFEADSSWGALARYLDLKAKLKEEERFASPLLSLLG